MVVNLRAKKRLVSRVVGVGVGRIRFDTEHLEDITDAITRENVRSLVTANTIRILPASGTSHGRANIRRIQRKKRGTTAGSKKGRQGARVGKKENHVAKVRALRRLIRIAKERKEMSNENFWILYGKIGGNLVRNKAHLRTLISEISP